MICRHFEEFAITVNRQMKFSVDLRRPRATDTPPTHCLLQSSTADDDCSCFPIQLDQDVRTVRNRARKFVILGLLVVIRSEVLITFSIARSANLPVFRLLRGRF